jgi:hypothetical protein
MQESDFWRYRLAKGEASLILRILQPSFDGWSSDYSDQFPVFLALLYMV